MKHQTPTIKATIRERTGTRYAQRVRSAGRLPAVIYGHKTDPVSVSVDSKEILDLLQRGQHVMELTLDSGGVETCLVKDLQFGFLGDNVIHIDFTRVNLKEEVTIHVRLNFVGAPAEAAQAGAILQHELTELTVKCMVSAIPEEVKVDLTKMEGSRLTAAEIELPEGLTLMEDPEAIVAAVTFIKRVAEAEAGEEADVETTEGEPEVISGTKDEDEDSKASEES